MEKATSGKSALICSNMPAIYNSQFMYCSIRERPVKSPR